MHQIEQDGVKLWFGNLMTPAPLGTVAPQQHPTVTFGVQPVSTRHRVGLRYRLNDSEPREQDGVWLWTDPKRQIQYFQVRLPSLAAGDRCEYGAIWRGPASDSESLGMLEMPARVAVVEPVADEAGLVAKSQSPQPPDSLNGFAMIFSVTQKAIFNAVIDDEAYADRWDFTVLTSKGKVRSELAADIAPPRIVISRDDRGNPYIEARFRMRGGTYSFWVIDPEDPSGNKFTSFPVEGWVLALRPDLAIAKIPWDSLTLEVREQLENFNENMFAVRQVVLNVTNTNLFDQAWKIEGPEVSGVDTNDPGFIRDMKASLQGVFEKKKGTENPYVFGHLVNQESVSPDSLVAVTEADATFRPTGVTYSVYADPKAKTPQEQDRNSLNYLLVNHGRPPSDPALGHFPRNWVTDPDSAGAFVVEHALFMREALKPAARELAPGKSYERQGTSQRWRLLDSDQDRGRQELPWYIPFRGNIKTRVDLDSVAWLVPGTGNMRIENKITYRHHVETGPKGIAKLKVHYLSEKTYEYSFGVNDQGEITLSKPKIFPGRMVKTKEDANTWWKIGSIALGPLFDYLVQIEIGKALDKALDLDIGELNALPLFLVMPAGRVLIFSRLRFTEAGHVYLDVQYDSNAETANAETARIGT